MNFTPNSKPRRNLVKPIRSNMRTMEDDTETVKPDSTAKPEHTTKSKKLTAEEETPADTDVDSAEEANKEGTEVESSEEASPMAEMFNSLDEAEKEELVSICANYAEQKASELAEVNGEGAEAGSSLPETGGAPLVP